MATKTVVKGTKKGASLDKKVAPAVKNLRGNVAPGKPTSI
jgi:hypothetical protein